MEDTLPLVYNYEYVLEKSTEYFNGDILAAQVWMNKYALKDKEGKYLELTPDDMHIRLASEIGRIEQNYPDPLSKEEIYNLIKDFKYIVPQGGPMTGIGNKYQLASLSNCFVVGNEFDSYGSIMRTDEEQVQLMKRRGGVGHDISHLRPDNTPTTNSAGTSTGAVSYMHRYSNSTREVAQNGRRGALMLSISIKHPDARKFISIKNDGTSITGANISVKIDDDFMNAVKNEETYTQEFPIGSKNPTHSFEINAKELWDEIIHNAWNRAEPGILFWDNIINESIPDCYEDFGFKTTSTNPCGEIPLCPYDSCRLLALNLYSYVTDPFTDGAQFDFELFDSHAKLALRFMDDIIDLEIEKLDLIINKINSDPETDSIKQVERDLWIKIKEKCIQGRRTGIGITAMGDMLAALGFTYGTTKATDFAAEIHRHLALNVYNSSIDLAQERGAFPIWDAELEKENPFLHRLFDQSTSLREDMSEFGRRNIACLTIAPTGTTSMMTQTSSGVEPAFQIYYMRRTKINPGDPNSRTDFIDEVGDHWMENPVFHHKFIEWYKTNFVIPPDKTPQEALEWFSKEDLDKLIEKSPWHNATANDVNWEEKVRMQGAIQKWVDHSISVTVNIPKESTEDLVNTIYITGWEVGCKGITVYRDGCRSGVLVTNKNEEPKPVFNDNNAPKRPKQLVAKVIRFQNNHEKWIAFIGLLDGKPYEIFTFKASDDMKIKSDVMGHIVKSKKDGHGKYDFVWEENDEQYIIEDIHACMDREFANYGKLLSGVMRHGMPMPFVINMVSNLHFIQDHITTWKNGVLRALRRFVKDGEEGGNCPDCSSKLVYAEGCLTCPSCGHSKCG